MTTILSFIFVLGILIFVHELGHFLVAKWSGVRVEKFSLGFPPKLLGFRIGETEYCISIIPLGGYVKMAGENPDESEVTGAPDEFMSKSPGKRAAIIAAGPVMNFITAFVIYTLLFMIQGELQRNDAAVVGNVKEDSPADSAGIVKGDLIVSIDGVPISSFDDLRENVHQKISEKLVVEIRRGDEVRSVTLVTAADSARDMQNQWVHFGIMGVEQDYWWEPVGFFASFRFGAERTWQMAGVVFDFLYRLITVQISPKMIGGPLFIAQISGDAARMGAAALFEFIAMLSVNLAILNVLPIPVLDGGHLIFLGIEVIRRRPLSLKQRALMQQVGMAFLLMLMVFITYNDIMRWITG